ncbi:MAG TPA: macro domain-containing protein [Euzebyales bacterium]|nr:macro domain-containing protein [Euzebyales bacterium]
MSTWQHDHLAARRVGGAALLAVQADITALDADAVVNAANEHLEHGGGVAAALARAGGPQVQRESRDWIERHGPLRPGQAAVTSAGAMPAAHVVHVVGPRYRSGQDNPGLLRAAVAAALDAAAGRGARTVALPAISAGIFGYPPAEATQVIAAACADWLAARPGTVDAVLLVGYDRAAAGLFADALGDVADDDV